MIIVHRELNLTGARPSPEKSSCCYARAYLLEDGVRDLIAERDARIGVKLPMHEQEKISAQPAARPPAAAKREFSKRR
jgi:hypothetical protein